MSVGTEELARLRGHRWQISCLQFSPDGSRLATGSWDKEARIWDLSSLETCAIMQNVHEVPLTTLSWYRPDGALLATGSADCTVGLWNSETGDNLLVMREHFGWVLGSAFSGDGRFLATSSWDKTIRLWDTASGELLNTLNGHTKGVWSVDFYPVGSSSMLCSGSEDATVRIWDARTNKPANCYSGGHKDAIYCSKWSPDGMYIATGSRDAKVVVWDSRSGKVVNFIHGHKDTVKSVAFNQPSVNLPTPILASAGDYTVKLSDPRPNMKSDILSISPHEFGKEVETVDISRDSSLLASGGRDGIIVLSTLYATLSAPSKAKEKIQKQSSTEYNSSKSHKQELLKQTEIELEETPLDSDAVLLRTGSTVNKDVHKRYSAKLKQSESQNSKNETKRGSPKKSSLLQRFQEQKKLSFEEMEPSPRDSIDLDDVVLTAQKDKSIKFGTQTRHLRGMEEGRQNYTRYARSSKFEDPSILSDLNRPVSLASDHFYNTIIRPNETEGQFTEVYSDTDTDEEDPDYEGPVSVI